jgi:threonylcarbamoyladenosine tRNA methylthiotransferase MtaB
LNATQIISLGCRMNIAESEQMRAMLAGADNLVVVNSCAVTAEALRQTRQAIRRARRDHPAARLVVTGCAAEIDRASIGAMAEVDGVVANALKLDPRAWNVPGDTLPPAPARTRAFVAVQNGCDHACTFCVIPQGRGASRSLTVSQVLAEIEAHLAHGAKEVVLTGVDLTSWRLSSVDGIEVDPLLFDLLAHEQRVMPHLHLSLQHGADLILKRMKRRHQRRDAVELVARLKALRPEIAIGADIIAGFPTEDDAHHAANLAIIDELDIVHAHVFPYSPRPGTPAARMPQLSRDVIKARATDLRARAAVRREAWLQSLVGETLPVLAERGDTGYAPNYAPVALPPGTTAGTIIDITPGAVREGLLA